MKRFKNELRIEVLAKRGICDIKLLDQGPHSEALDVAIISTASDCLSKTELITFFFAFYCTMDWSDIQLFYLNKLEREVSEETVKSYAERASAKIILTARKSLPLKEWQAAWLKAQHNALQSK